MLKKLRLILPNFIDVIVMAQKNIISDLEHSENGIVKVYSVSLCLLDDTKVIILKILFSIL